MMNLLTIDEVSKKLEEWANNLTYSPPSPTMIRLLPDVGQDKLILWLLAEMPAVGQKVEKDFEILYQMHDDIYGWRDKVITEDEWTEFTAQVETVKGVAYELVGTLRQIAQKARQELSLEQPAETERNNAPSKGSRIGAWLWKLYEKSLKVIVDAYLERVLPK